MHRREALRGRVLSASQRAFIKRLRRSKHRTEKGTGGCPAVPGNKVRGKVLLPGQKGTKNHPDSARQENYGGRSKALPFPSKGTPPIIQQLPRLGFKTQAA